jgi:DNA-directed RNA polymerase specialized sigma subunit
MSKQKIISIIIFILLVSNAFFGIEYFAVQKEFRQTQTSLETQKTNEEILEFTKLFIQKVLRAETEIDFENRLKLENTVRDLKDEEILTQWQKFTESKSEIQAQEEVKNLLEMLINKIKTQ